MKDSSFLYIKCAKIFESEGKIEIGLLFIKLSGDPSLNMGTILVIINKSGMR